MEGIDCLLRFWFLSRFCLKSRKEGRRILDPQKCECKHIALKNKKCRLCPQSCFMHDLRAVRKFSSRISLEPKCLIRKNREKLSLPPSANRNGNYQKSIFDRMINSTHLQRSRQSKIYFMYYYWHQTGRSLILEVVL